MMTCACHADRLTIMIWSYKVQVDHDGGRMQGHTFGGHQVEKVCAFDPEVGEIPWNAGELLLCSVRFRKVQKWRKSRFSSLSLIRVPWVEEGPFEHVLSASSRQAITQTLDTAAVIASSLEPEHHDSKILCSVHEPLLAQPLGANASTHDRNLNSGCRRRCCEQAGVSALRAQGPQ